MNHNSQVINNYKEEEDDEELPAYTSPINIEIHPLNIHFIESQYYRDRSTSCRSNNRRRQRCNFCRSSSTKKNKKSKIRRVFSSLCFFTYKIML
jgi:hypothetical protein